MSSWLHLPKPFTMFGRNLVCWLQNQPKLDLIVYLPRLLIIGQLITFSHRNTGWMVGAFRFMNSYYNHILVSSCAILLSIILYVFRNSLILMTIIFYAHERCSDHNIMWRSQWLVFAAMISIQHSIAFSKGVESLELL